MAGQTESGQFGLGSELRSQLSDQASQGNRGSPTRIKLATLCGRRLKYRLTSNTAIMHYFLRIAIFIDNIASIFFILTAF